MSLFRPLPLLFAISLCAAVAPVHAQRVSLADRVAVLEQQAANNQANTDLLNQLTQLRQEVTELRGMVEQLQNDNEQLKQRSRDQYLDLDGRLNRLESGALPATPPLAPPTTGAAKPAANKPVAATTAETAPSVHGDVGAMAQAGDERAAYDVAFNALKAGNYVDAAQLFTSFLELYPGGVYAPNALYWLGESYYVTQNYRLAAEQFNTLLGRYPTHDKAAGALLKLGLSEYGLGQVEQAENTLAAVVDKYPGSDVARTADDRLKSIQLGRSIR
ncbi:MAG: tol-pal system protein YbgF [Pseudoxanthomonas sp.]